VSPDLRDARRSSFDPAGELASSSTISGAVGIASEQLRARYRSYCTRQGRELLALLPREGLRALIRSTREAGEGELDFSSTDGLQLLAERCEALLPLPPFAVWIRDFQQNRAAYSGPEAPPVAPEGVDRGPVTVDVREFQAGDGGTWVVALDLQGSSDRWSGALRFHCPPDPIVYATGSILRETDALSVRDRFHAFDRATLRAMLRSALP